MADFGIQSWTPGQDIDAGSESTIAPTVDAAVAASTAHWQELESDTLHTGTVLGDKMVMPPAADEDSTILMPLPGVPLAPPGQGGSYDGSNMGGRS